MKICGTLCDISELAQEHYYQDVASVTIQCGMLWITLAAKYMYIIFHPNDFATAVCIKMSIS